MQTMSWHPKSCIGKNTVAKKRQNELTQQLWERLGTLKRVVKQGPVYQKAKGDVECPGAWLSIQARVVCQGLTLNPGAPGSAEKPDGGSGAAAKSLPCESVSSQGLPWGRGAGSSQLAEAEGWRQAAWVLTPAPWPAG